MISASFKIEHFQTAAIQKPLERATYKNLGHAAASIRKQAMASIVRATGPSAPGTPPHTHGRTATRKKIGSFSRSRRGGDFLKNAIVFANDRKAQEAVIGPRYSRVGDVGATHEFGEMRFGVHYPKRPFMGPSLDKNTDRFGASFAGSMGG